MFTVILISTVAILVAIVGCAVIWRLDAARADEVERTPPPPVRPTPAREGLGAPVHPAPPSLS